MRVKQEQNVLEVEVRLRRKNQLTLPEPIAQRLGVGPGDRFVFRLVEEQAGRVEMRYLRASYAGAAPGIYGAESEAAEYVRRERASWHE